jgi:hypothetical protein
VADDALWRERELGAMYRPFATQAAPALPVDLASHLRRAGFSDDDDVRDLRDYVESHADGVRATLAAAAHDPLASRLLAPEVLLILQHLDTDALQLRRAWPSQCPIEPLLALADIFGRPFAD